MYDNLIHSSKKLASIANFWMAKWNSETTDIPETTVMKIIKLTYIAHGYMLAIFKTDLYKENTLAWKYGPVIPELYKDLRNYGSKQVKHPICAFGFVEEGKYDVVPLNYDFSEDEQEILNLVWHKYKHLDAMDLSALTHQKNTPWDLTKENDRIPKELIKKHYEEMINEMI